jgi:uncharacterized coiled-coil protein SlyX
MSTAQAKTNTPESIEAQLAQKRARRDEIKAQMEAATDEVKAATAAVIDGGDASLLTQTRASLDALNSAVKEIENQISALEESLQAAREDFEKESALKATAVALEEYDAATLAFQGALRQFMASGKGEAVLQAVSLVRQCEQAELRAGFRPKWKASVLEYPRACGNAEIIVGQICAHISGTQYATSDIPAGKRTEYADEFPAPIAQLSKAGIS